MDTFFGKHNCLNHQNYKNKQLNNTQKNKVSNKKNSPLELELYFKPITVSIDDMDKFEEEKNIYKKHLALLLRLVN